MKLDRNITEPRRGKYALIKLRIDEPSGVGCMYQIKPEAVDFGDTEDTDFFVIRLKDKYAAAALFAYAKAAYSDDPEYANEIIALAVEARDHPNKKKPD